MSQYYRAILRVFGPTEGVFAVHQKVLSAEQEWPSHDFSLAWLTPSGQSQGYRTLVIRAELSHRLPSIAALDLASAIWSKYPGLTLERVTDDDDSVETVEIFQNSERVFHLIRQEATGDIYELGAQGVEYVSGKPVGNHQALMQSMLKAGVIEPLRPF